MHREICKGVFLLARSVVLGGFGRFHQIIEKNTIRVVEIEYRLCYNVSV